MIGLGLSLIHKLSFSFLESISLSISASLPLDRVLRVILLAALVESALVQGLYVTEASSRAPSKESSEGFLTGEIVGFELVPPFIMRLDLLFWVSGEKVARVLFQITLNTYLALGCEL